MDFLQPIVFLLLGIAPGDNGVLSLICGERICKYGTHEYVCDSDTCRCTDKFSIIKPSTMYPDVDICLKTCSRISPGSCPTRSWCRYTPGMGFTVGVCLCSEGYYITSTGKCVDIKECKQANNCLEQPTCTSVTGENKCVCRKGFQWDGSACRPIDSDECLTDGVCDSKDNSVCVNTIGSFVCDCLPEYNTSGFNTSCHDIDECEENPSVCGEHYSCENLPGNYSCLCLEGFTLSLDGNSTCVPDESVERAETNNGTAVGLYVGVTFGALILLIVVTVAILIRRRRKSGKSGEGKADLSLRHSEENSDYTELPSDNRHDKTLSVEYSNAQIPKNKLDRRQNAVSVEYSNNEIIPKSERNEDKAVSNQSEGERVNSSPHGEHVFPSYCDDYNTLDSCNLNRAVNNTVDGHTVEGDNPYNTLYTEIPILPKSERNENKDLSNQSEGEEVYSAPYEG